MTTQSSPNIVQAPTTRFKGRLARRLLLILVPLSLVPIFLMGGTAYARARALLLEQTSNQITTFHDEQVSSFNNWVVTKEVRLDRLARKESFITNSAEIIRGRRFSTSYKEAEAAILSDLQSINLTAAQSIFNQYMLVSPNGDVILSTVPDWQGLNLNLVQAIGSLDLWSQKHTLALYSPEPLYSETFVIFSSQPIENQNGESIAAIVGISESLAIRSILIADLQFLPDSDAYFITADGTFVGIDKFTGELTSLAVNETQRQTLLNAGQSEELNIISFESFDQDLVIAGYSWLPFLNTGLIVEVPQASIYQQINSLAPFTLVLVALSAVGLALIVIIGTRGLVNPVIQVAEASRLFSEGDWQMRAAVNRNDEIGLLAHSFNHMADELSNLYRSLKFEVDERTRQVITASEVGQLATSAKSLNELMHTTVNLIVDRFGYYHAAIFLVDSAGEFAELREATGEAGHNLKSQGYRLSLDSQSIISWVINNNLPRIASDTLADEIYIAHELLPETHSEVGIPISLGGEILGVLDVQSTKTSAFDEESVNVLQTLSNQLATAIQNFRLLEGTEIDRQEITTLYRASRQISNASTDIEIFQTAVEAIQRSSYTSAIYIASRDHFKLVTAQDQSDEFYARFPKILHISNQAAKTYFPSTTPLVIEDIQKPNVSISTELLIMPQQLACQAAAFFPIMHANAITAIMILGSHDRGNVSQTRIQPYASLAELTATALEKVFALQESRSRIADLQILNELSNVITTESDINILYPSIYSHINKILGEVDFYIALYDAGSEHISFPFVHEAGENVQLDSIPLGEGLTSIVVRTRKPLLLVEDTEQKAISMGAKIIGQSAKSWLGIPLVIADKILGVMTVQDAEREHRFTENDMHLLSTLASQIAGAINNAQLLDESKRRALQLQTAAEIARDTSGTLEQSELLRKAINLIRERYDFYHASVFLMDSSREFAYVKESTGEAGRQMIANQHKLQVGSQSVIGTATATGQPLVVNDVTTDPTHRFNPLLPDTRSELGIPLKIGNRILGALDVQSTQPYAFSADDIEVLQILADQLAIAVANTDLFSETQEHLAQHRLIHHVTTVAASASSLDEALTNTVQGLRATLGDRVSILLLDAATRQLQIAAADGYETAILGTQIKIGEGITGWVAENRQPIFVNNVTEDPRYIPGVQSVQSELAVPLIYRGELLGVLNVESDNFNAFDEHDQDILGTLAGSLSAIIINTRLSERQRQLFEITNKIHRSINMGTIMQTTAAELSRVLQTRRAQIQITSDKQPPTREPIIAVEPHNGKEEIQ